MKLKHLFSIMNRGLRKSNEVNKMTEQYQQKNINLDYKKSDGKFFPDFSVNESSVDSGYGDESIVLRTSSRTNAAGGFVGGGETGNKSIFGAFGFNNLPISSLVSIEYSWENVVGPAGINYIPPEPTTVVTPYINLVVDFDPNGSHDYRIIVVSTDQLNPLINNSVGTYINNGSNVLTYSWNNSQNALIALSPPNPSPGGVVPDVSVGPSWLDNSYKWSDIVSLNPGAVLSDAYPGDSGLPAGAIVPSIMLVSGDSGTLIKSGKKIFNMSVNGSSIFG